MECLVVDGRDPFVGKTEPPESRDLSLNLYVSHNLSNHSHNGPPSARRMIRIARLSAGF